MTKDEIMKKYDIKKSTFYKWIRIGLIDVQGKDYIVLKKGPKGEHEDYPGKIEGPVKKYTTKSRNGRYYRVLEYSKPQLLSMIDKVRRQAGYVYMDDCYLIISIYTDIFGVIYTSMSVEDELTYMFKRCVRYSKDPTIYKICITCKVEKDESNFVVSKETLDGYDIYCRDCRRHKQLLDSRKRRAQCKEPQ